MLLWVVGLCPAEVARRVCHKLGSGRLAAEAVSLTLNLRIDGAVRLYVLAVCEAHRAHVVVLAGHGKSCSGHADEESPREGGTDARSHVHLLSVGDLRRAFRRQLYAWLVPSSVTNVTYYRPEGTTRGWLSCMVEPDGARAVSAMEVPMKVKEVMHKGVDWVGPDTPVTDLAKLMLKHDIGAIPIGANDQLIGMVTDRDIICKGLAKDNFNAQRATARDVMTPGIHCCREDDNLAKAVRHMEELKIRRLPVINKSKRMVGILSLGDVGHSAPGDLLTEYVKTVSAHHH